MLQYCNISLKKVYHTKMATVDNFMQVPKRKSSLVILPPLKLECIDETRESVHSETRIITPHTPPTENPNAILKDKLMKRMSDELIKSMSAKKLNLVETS